MTAAIDTKAVLFVLKLSVLFILSPVDVIATQRRSWTRHERPDGAAGQPKSSAVHDAVHF
jgi:hypothetical protein